jgi:hypothetical protein
MIIDFKKVKNYEIEGIETDDYPDFSNAYISSCDYKGKYASDIELNFINEQCDFISELALEQLI